MRHTNVEQSKHLIELGLDVNTSDLTIEVGIPSWTTEQLLDLLPDKFEKDDTLYRIFFEKSVAYEETYKRVTVGGYLDNSGFPLITFNTNFDENCKSLFEIVYYLMEWYLTNKDDLKL